MAIRSGSRGSLQGMIKLQGLTKARHEMQLSRLTAQSVAIDEENTALFKMQNDRFENGGGIVPADLIMKRLETNKAKEADLSERMTFEKRDLLMVSRTLDILRDRLRQLEQDMERIAAADEIEEYVIHTIAGGTSLP
ncbi:hypothetical protein [Phyllobacterium sp. OV277]|uniref:hypothetical protein n=1 Tax=Phyllobacterium sp. OV277 TaxID=1882772 RepID=UPI0008840CB8|nr:hypothetical protein [Phyllobacterium sp. OV277]SDP79263.1 hypothetical protein SAMN05443582_11076 [Phyllobacterium sp. OV277]